MSNPNHSPSLLHTCGMPLSKSLRTIAPPTCPRLRHRHPRFGRLFPSATAETSSKTTSKQPKEGPSTSLAVISQRLSTLATPYWTEGPQAASARWNLAGVLALTLGTTGVSVLFNFLGRDFFNALSAKDQATFTEMLFKWLGM